MTSETAIPIDHPCLIIGEVAQAHDGSLGAAHAFIDAIASTGADAVKFQTHIAAAESTPSEPFRVKFSRQDASRYEYWKRMEFTPAQWSELAQHAGERGLLFLSSPFSVEAVELLAALEMPMWKIASGEVTTPGIFERILETGRPVLLSTGMSPLAEIDEAVRRVREAGSQITVMQCTSAYPCPPEKVGLNLIPFFRDRYECPAGLSDHSGTIYPGLAATTLGASVVEVHVAFSREMFGPDVPASLTAPELRQLVEGVRFIEEMMSHPVDKDAAAAEMAPLRELFTKSVVIRQALPAGTILQRDHLAAKKPGTGIPASRLPELVGGRLLRDVGDDELLQDEDIEFVQSTEEDCE